MIIGEVIGTVVCTQKEESLNSTKMLLVQPCHISSLKPESSPLVALDAVGAGIGELVLVVGGSSARNAKGYSKVTVDQSIVGIIDYIYIKDKQIYSKNEYSDNEINR